MQQQAPKGGKIFPIIFGSVFIFIALMNIRTALILKAYPVIIVGILFVLVGIMIIVQTVKPPKNKKTNNENQSDIANVSTLDSDSFFDTTSSYKVTTNFCVNCGTKLKDEDRFCPGCGKKIKN